MKKVVQAFIIVFIAAFALIGVASYLNSSNGYSGANTLTVYNWGDYIDPDRSTNSSARQGSGLSTRHSIPMRRC